MATPQFPDFPVPVKQTAGARIGNTLYVGLGSAGKAWYSLDIATPGAAWTALAEFPDVPREAASAVAIGKAIYIFAGQGKLRAEDANIRVFDTVYKYDTVLNQWSRVPTRTPQGALAAAALSIDGENIVFFGGVNKTIFDDYSEQYFVAAAGDSIKQTELSVRYFGQRPQDYMFTASIVSYNPAQNQWRQLGLDPQAPTVGAAVVRLGNQITLIGGELKPGLRSPSVKSLVLNGEELRWLRPVAMPAPAGETVQEGLAGAVAGYSNGALLVAGGSNFPGSWQQFNQGQLYAHKGLTKIWRDQIYAQVQGQWREVGKLPVGLGYASYFQLEDGVLIVGGELQGGLPSKEVYLLKWNGKGVDIVR